MSRPTRELDPSLTSRLIYRLGIDVVIDLPGVGMHLTDHLSAEIAYNTTGVSITGDGVETNTTIAAEQLALWLANDPSSLYNSPNDAIACNWLICGPARACLTRLAIQTLISLQEACSCCALRLPSDSFAPCRPSSAARPRRPLSQTSHPTSLRWSERTRQKVSFELDSQ